MDRPFRGFRPFDRLISPLFHLLAALSSSQCLESSLDSLLETKIHGMQFQELVMCVDAIISSLALADLWMTA